MSTFLKARIVKIGNSQGIRIPKVWLEQLDLGNEVEIAVQSDQIIIRSAHRPRHDWNEQFQAMAMHGDDPLLDETIATRWDEEEWEW
jgi:antitoxin MazE